jgi:hypothetical protein
VDDRGTHVAPLNWMQPGFTPTNISGFHHLG